MPSVFDGGPNAGWGYRIFVAILIVLLALWLFVAPALIR